MKNFLKLFGIIALAAVIGFSVIACDNGTTSGGGGLNGTWVDRDGDKISFNNGNFSMYDGNVEVVRGMYSTSGTTMTLTITSIRGSAFGSSAAEMGVSVNSFYTRAQIRQIFVNYAIGQGYSQSDAGMIADLALGNGNPSINSLFDPSTVTYSLNGNTLTLGNVTYTRQ